jgi:hypothetical protein
MTTPDSAQIARARRLLAYEGAADASLDACANAVGRIYDKITERLIPLLGSAGVQALFLRSATLVRSEFTALVDLSAVESSSMLRERFQTLEQSVAARAAETLFGSFFALVTTFIGERLTTQALRGAWPTIEAAAFPENEK